MGRKKGTLYPKDWLSGPDPVDHRLYNDCLRARAQAWYRGEEWLLTEQEYIQLWRVNDNYLRKGRTTGSLCLIRIDIERAWHIDNVEVIERHRHFRRARQIQKEKHHAGTWI